MYCRWILFSLEVKKFIRLLPFIVAETALFVVLLIGIGLYGAKAVYGEKAVDSIRIGISGGEEDKAVNMLVDFAASMDSLEDTVSFWRLSEAEAREKLGTGEIYGALLLPDGLVDDIMSGKNTPAVVLLDQAYSKMETEVFAQLTRAGADLLATAQAGIYAADAFCVETGREDLIGKSENYLNREYIDYAMGRTSLLKEREVNAFQGVNLTDYYGISLFLAFFSFAGLGLGRFVQVDSGERERIWRARGIGTVQRYLIETAAFAIVLAFLGIALGIPFYLFFVGNTGSSFEPGLSWLGLWVVFVTVGFFLKAFLELFGNHSGGLGAGFAALIFGMAASGLFIPSSFLPLWMEDIGNIFPFKGWAEAMAVILQGKNGSRLLAGLLAGAFIFLAAGILLAIVREFPAVIVLKKKRA